MFVFRWFHVDQRYLNVPCHSLHTASLWVCVSEWSCEVINFEQRCLLALAPSCSGWCVSTSLFPLFSLQCELSGGLGMVLATSSGSISLPSDPLSPGWLEWSVLTAGSGRAAFTCEWISDNREDKWEQNHNRHWWRESPSLVLHVGPRCGGRANKISNFLSPLYASPLLTHGPTHVSIWHSEETML